MLEARVTRGGFETIHGPKDGHGGGGDGDEKNACGACGRNAEFGGATEGSGCTGGSKNCKCKVATSKLKCACARECRGEQDQSEWVDTVDKCSS